MGLPSSITAAVVGTASIIGLGASGTSAGTTVPPTGATEELLDVVSRGDEHGEMDELGECIELVGETDRRVGVHTGGQLMLRPRCWRDVVVVLELRVCRAENPALLRLLDGYDLFREEDAKDSYDMDVVDMRAKGEYEGEADDGVDGRVVDATARPLNICLTKEARSTGGSAAEVCWRADARKEATRGSDTLRWCTDLSSSPRAVLSWQ